MRKQKTASHRKLNENVFFLGNEKTKAAHRHSEHTNIHQQLIPLNKMRRSSLTQFGHKEEQQYENERSNRYLEL